MSRASGSVSKTPVRTTLDAGYSAFRALMLSLPCEPKKLMESPSRAVRDICDYAKTFFPSCNSESLEAALPTCPVGRTRLANGYIYLDHVERGPTIPVLTFECDFARPKPEVRLRVVLLRARRNGASKSPTQVGYRFETPETGTPGGTDVVMHAYYHAQHLEKVGQTALDLEPGSSSECPAFPLDAKCPVTLVFALLISLYGVTDSRVKDLLTRGSGDVRAMWCNAIRQLHFGDPCSPSGFLAALPQKGGQNMP